MRDIRQKRLKFGSVALRRSGVFVPFLALLFLSTGCFESEQSKEREFRAGKLGPDRIWPLAGSTRQIEPVKEVAAGDQSSFIQYYGYRTRTAEAADLLTIYAMSPDEPTVERLSSVSAGNGRAREGSSPFARPDHASVSGATSPAVLGQSFASLFNSLFGKGIQGADEAADAVTGEDRNPFREAKENPEAKREATEAETPKTEKPVAAEQPKPAENPSQNSTPPWNPAAAKFVFFGDFDANGVLEAKEAKRTDAGSFSFSDGDRAFNLFINTSAVDLQKSLAVDDVNGDGVADLLVASRAAVSGAVLAGNGDGAFHFTDSFVTGYEPNLVTAGPSVGGMRDIVVFNTRSGIASVFRKTDRYQKVSSQPLNSLAEYIGHFITMQDGLDYFMTGRSGQAQTVYCWREDGTLADFGNPLPGDPSLSLGKDLLSQNLVNQMRLYQVGSHASLTLSNGRGQSYNVMNMRVWPNFFIAIGDLGDQGTLDVAVGYLVSFIPAK